MKEKNDLLNPVEPAEFKLMRANYLNIRRPNGVNITLPKVDEGQTEWIWFSKEQLETMLSQVAQVGQDEEAGVKFYFLTYIRDGGTGATPPDYIRANTGKKIPYKGRQTLVMSPCKRIKGASGAEDVFEDVKVLKSDGEKDYLYLAPVAYENKGTLCPPTCPFP